MEGPRVEWSRVERVLGEELKKILFGKFEGICGLNTENKNDTNICNI